MSFLDDIFGSKKTQQTATTSSPWGPQIPHLTKQFGEAEKLYDAGGPQYFPGQTLTDRNALIGEGEQGQLDYLGGSDFSNMMDKSYQSTTGNLGGGYTGYGQLFGDPNVGAAYTQALSGDPSPYTEAAARATREDMAEDYTGIGGIGSQIRGAGVMSGQHGGGTRQGLMERKGMDDLDENMRQMTANMYQQDYGDAQNRMLSGIGLAEGAAGRMGQEDLNRYGTAMSYVPQQYGMTMGGYDAMKGIGTDQMDYSQAQIEDERARHDYEANLPYENLGWYKGLTSGDYGGTSIGTGTARGRDSAYNIGKGVGTDASGAAGIMSAMGMFSDRRLKKNIHKIGKLVNGLNVYTFDYIWGESSVGVMSDEVRKVKPNAVTNFHGFDVVDYAEIL